MISTEVEYALRSVSVWIDTGEDAKENSVRRVISPGMLLRLII